MGHVLQYIYVYIFMYNDLSNAVRVTILVLSKLVIFTVSSKFALRFVARLRLYYSYILNKK